MDYLPFHLPDISEDEIDEVVHTLRSGWLTTGPKVAAFEKSFAAYLGAPFAVAVNSGTAALHLALEAAGIGAGDEVILPTMTFTATAEVVVHLRARPVLVDCDARTLNIDPQEIAAAITPQTKAIIPVHFAGHPAELDQIAQLARNYDLKVIDDAAHALPASYKGKSVGTLAHLTAFSFYATKTITTGEGGMITTDNGDYADRVRMMSLHGISKNAWTRYTAKGHWHYEVFSPGYKYNLTDIAASIGVQQLRKADHFRACRERIAASYTAAFRDLAEVATPVALPNVSHAWHLYVIQLDLDRLRITRDQFIDLLSAQRIGTSVHFIPLHLQPYYRTTFGYCPTDFPRATAASKRTISLPIYPRMTEEEVQRVIDAVTSICASYRT